MKLAALLLTLALTACSSALAPSTSPPSVPSATATSTSAVTTAPSGSATPRASSSASPIALPTVTTLAAASGGVVWAYVGGDHLFVSLNRGDTWTERALPASPRDGYNAFISAGEGWWLVPSPPGPPCSFQAVTLWKTDDGAVTWRKLDASGIDEIRCKSGVAFSGPGVGFITAWDPNRSPVIYHTSDGGRSWSASQPLRDPPGFTTAGGSSLQVANIGDFGDVLFADAFGSVGGALKHFVYRSVDRGATWSYASTTLQSVAIVFVTPTRWLQITVPSDSRETTDGGNTWHFFASDYQQAAPIAPQIVYGDANVGYATVRGSIQRTLDGGVHWTGIKTPGT
jgi:photosystem II stability/assembly factor-like uncharacterized protein